MNRLDTRIKRLEETGAGNDGNDGDEPFLFGVTRILLDQHGNEMSRGFVVAPVAPLLIPVPPASEPIDPEDSTPEIPVLTSYKDEPWLVTGQQWKELLKVISGKSRSVHQEPLTEEDNAELARTFS